MDDEGGVLIYDVITTWEEPGRLDLGLIDWFYHKHI